MITIRSLTIALSKEGVARGDSTFGAVRLRTRVLAFDFLLAHAPFHPGHSDGGERTNQRNNDSNYGLFAQIGWLVAHARRNLSSGHYARGLK